MIPNGSPVKSIQSKTTPQQQFANKSLTPAKVVDDEWSQLKQQNQEFNNEIRSVDTHAALNAKDYPLPLNPDGSLSFYWIDAHEENNGNGADLFIFGKVFQPQVNQYVSCSIKVIGMQRVAYALPKLSGKARGTLTKEEEQKLIRDVQLEFEDLRKKRFTGITKWRCKAVTRKYAFEMPIQHGEHLFLKIKYDATCPPLPVNLTGKTFDCVFGANQSMLELFILKRKIKGPCWVTLKNPHKVTEFQKTWCRQEIIIDDPKNFEITIDDLNRQDIPPLISMTFSFKTTRSQNNTNEIAMISCLIHTNIN